MHKLLLFICLLFSVAGHAKTETQEKVKVLNLMKKYTELISCSNTFGENDLNRKTTIKDVFTIERDKETGSRTYFVWWGGAAPCSLANTGFSSYISSVYRESKELPFNVTSDFAFGEDLNINSRFIESVTQLSTEKFKIISWDYADNKYGGVDGGMHFPANKFEYIIEYDTNSFGWIITRQRLLEQRN